MLPLYFVEERGFDLTLANTLIGVAQLSGVVMLFFSGWLTDKIGQKKMMASSLLVAALLTVLLSWTKGWLLLVVLFLQPAVLTAFFPAGFAALSRIAEPSMRSVVNALGPPVAFLIGGGVMPAIIGYMAETYSFSAGIFFAGCFILIGPVLVIFVRLGDYDDQDGC
jgi:NNP family nitrate/nitrite transporter-like MFS transporter